VRLAEKIPSADGSSRGLFSLNILFIGGLSFPKDASRAIIFWQWQNSAVCENPSKVPGQPEAPPQLYSSLSLLERTIPTPVGRFVADFTGLESGNAPTRCLR
jgi:hypothetical protein